MNFQRQAREGTQTPNNRERARVALQSTQVVREAKAIQEQVCSTNACGKCGKCVGQKSSIKRQAHPIWQSGPQEQNLRSVPAGSHTKQQPMNEDSERTNFECGSCGRAFD